MKLRPLVGDVLRAALLIAFGLSAPAAEQSAARVAAFSQLPDWRGVWEVEGSTATIGGQSGALAIDAVPYTVEWRKKYATARAANSRLRDSYERYCYAGVPRMMASPQQLMFVITPEETVVLGARHDIRHLWTDGRAHTPADEMWPMFWGDSIAQWQGNTLVVNTISLKGGLWLDPTGATLSDRAHVTERISSPQVGQLRNEITIEDPEALTRAWTFVRTYQRSSASDLSEADCQWSAGSAGTLNK